MVETLLDIGHELGLVPREERKDTSYQDEEVDSHAPYVGLVVVGVPLHDLRGHAQRRAAVCVHGLLDVAELLRETEVCYLDLKALLIKELCDLLLNLRKTHRRIELLIVF
jgi:hypothetical protein